MSASVSRWSLFGVSLTCVLLAGCKSSPSSTNWLGFNKKPSTTALTSHARPSANALPGPSASVNPNAVAGGRQYGGSPYSQTGYQGQADQGFQNPQGYQAGQYNMASGSGGHSSTSGAVTGTPTSRYGTQQAVGPYQSPYRSSQGGATYTADAGSGASYGAVSPGAAARSEVWNSDQWRRGGDATAASGIQSHDSVGSSTHGGNSSYGDSTTGPTGYSTGTSNYGTSASSYQQAQGTASPATYPTTSSYQSPGAQGAAATAPSTAIKAWASDLGESNSSGTPAAAPTSAGLSGSSVPGTWRPGSTANGLDSQPAATTTTPATYPAARGYPSTGRYPTSSSPTYPAAANNPTTTNPAVSSGQSWSGGGYPTTGR